MAQGRKEGTGNMRNKKGMWYGIIGTLIWFVVYIILIGNYASYDDFNVTDKGTFMGAASVNVKDDWVGANIWLKQAVHGTDGVKYRYVIETDCPSWDFETRYMTDKPIDWVDETSAVEVIIYDVRVYYEGTVYANGQYFTIPILDGLSSEDITYKEWQQNLVKQAYQAYVVDKDSDRMRFILSAGAGAVIPVILWILLLFPAFTGTNVAVKVFLPRGRKKKEEKDA